MRARRGSAIPTTWPCAWATTTPSATSIARSDCASSLSVRPPTAFSSTAIPLPRWGVSPPAAAGTGPATAAGELLERFAMFLTAERGLAGKTRGAHLKSACRFLAAGGRAGEGGPPAGALTASDVTGFLAGMARIQAPGTTQNTASMLRTFLTWLYAEGLIPAPLAGG